MSRTVKCKKYDKDMPGLEKPPFSGEVGQMIYEQISADAWNAWTKDMQIKVINEYRLNMGVKADYDKLVEQMMLFLNLKTGENLEVENPDRGQ